MQKSATDSHGLFAVEAAANDRDLTLRFDGDDRYPPLRTRPLGLGEAPYTVDGDVKLALRTARRQSLQSLEDIEFDPERGLVSVTVGRVGRLGFLADASAVLIGLRQPTAFYFNGGAPDADRTTTSEAESIVLFVNVEPGSYMLSVSHPQAASCPGAGADAPDPIELDEGRKLRG
jgi:hypothetical protein